MELADLQGMWFKLQAQVERLAEERRQYLDFFEQSPEAYLVTDGLGRISEVNGAAVDILQRRKHLLRGKPLGVLVVVEERAEFRHRLKAIVDGSTERSWLATIAAPEGRVEVTLTARLMGAGGICWRLQAME